MNWLVCSGPVRFLLHAGGGPELPGQDLREAVAAGLLLFSQHGQGLEPQPTVLSALPHARLW